MEPVTLAIIGAAGWAAWNARKGKGVSAREDSREGTVSASADYGVADPLLDALGWLYTWGGSPRTWGDAEQLARAGRGVVDCSGFASLALVRMGLRKSYKRYTALTLANASDPVAWGKQQPGDIAVYPGHVMIVLSRPRSDGDSKVIGASGGGSKTRGNDPNARVKVFDSARYRKDFMTFGRLKATERA
jgi:cell wall-associated NlpC family hydrolase